MLGRGVRLVTGFDVCVGVWMCVFVFVWGGGGVLGVCRGGRSGFEKRRELELREDKDKDKIGSSNLSL
jgi:hypothetical protein